MDGATLLRAAAPVAVAFFGVRRASEGTQPVGGDVHLADEKGVAQARVKRQKHDQFWVGQMAHLVTMNSWVAPCPARLLSGRLWPRGWLRRRRGHAGRLSGAEGGRPLFAGLVRAKIGVGVAASGMTASWNKVLERRVLSPRQGGARMYILDGISREATRELGGRKTPSVTESLYGKAKSEEVAPEMRAAIRRA